MKRTEKPIIFSGPMVRASTGKRKWMSVTQQYKKQVNYCPMCGRKLEVEG